VALGTADHVMKTKLETSADPGDLVTFAKFGHQIGGFCSVGVEV
jgi:hypothetical protein